MNRKSISIRVFLLVSLLGALALVFTACGGGSSYGGGGSSNAGGAATAAGNTASVSMKNIAFNPADLTVSKGTKVTWTNDDSVAHTVTADNGMFDSGNVDPGQSFSFTFDQPGTIAYHCKIHVAQEMNGNITVK